jgi:sec-independent protein translocase protein TatB
MFDITSSKLLLLGIVALLVIGPKDFPALLRTIGKYVGIIRGHAKEFRAQFDEAMREAELSELKKDVEGIAQETEASLRAAEQTVTKNFEEVRQSVDSSLDTLKQPDPFGHDASGLPIAAPEPAPAAAATNGASEPPPGGEAQQSAGSPSETATQSPAAEPSRPVEKSGA